MKRKNVFIFILIVCISVIGVLSCIKQKNNKSSPIQNNVVERHIEKATIEDINSNKTKEDLDVVIPEVKEENIVQSVIIEQPQETISNKTPAKNNDTKEINISNQNVTTTTTQTNPTPIPQSTISPSNVENTTTTETIIRCTNNNDHGMSIGNCMKWFSNKSDAIAYYDSQISCWGKQWENQQIDDSTYYKNCPTGYEIWSCMYCNKWTINFYYR